MQHLQALPKPRPAAPVFDPGKYGGGIHLTVKPDPFRAANRKEIIPPGRTVFEIVDQYAPRAKVRSVRRHVWIEGHKVESGVWHLVRPKPGASMAVIQALPRGGGGGKNPLGAILSIGLSIAAPGIGTALAGSLGFGGMWVGSLFFPGGYILGGLVSLAGRLVIGALAPPPKPRRSGSLADTPTLFISGARNQLVPFGVVPRPFGKMRIVPPYAARPYTETVGSDQYVRCLFNCGYGPLNLSQFKIGDTLLSQFKNVDVDVRQGYLTDTPITLFPDQVIQNDLSIVLKQADGYNIRTTEANVDEISLDLTLPRGLVKFDSAGNKTSLTVQCEVQYAPTGTSNWSNPVASYTAYAGQNVNNLSPPGGNGKSQNYLVYINPADGSVKIITGPVASNNAVPEVPLVPTGMLGLALVLRKSSDPGPIPAGNITDIRDQTKVGDYFQAAGDFLPSTSATNNRLVLAAGGLSFPGLKITAKQTSAIRQELRFPVATGQYDVRVRRITADSDPTDEKTIDEVDWTALRSIRLEQPVNQIGVALVAIRIKATDQLSGSLDQFNCVVESILPDWDGAAWGNRADQTTWVITSNPASIYREILQGAANARAVDDTRVDTAGLGAWHDACAAALREYNSTLDRQMSVVEALAEVASIGRAAPSLIDGKWGVVEDKIRTTIVQHFTPRNSWAFQGQKPFPPLPHALRVKFINRDAGWQPDERIVYDDGYSSDGSVPGTVAAALFESWDLPGVTSTDQAWREGRYHIATGRLRPETFSFTADFEHIPCTRGDLIRFTHDVPLLGLGQARVKALTVIAGNITAVTLDDTVVMENGVNYGIRFRKSDGTSIVHPVNTAAGENTVLVFSDVVPSAGGPAVGDLALFGLAGAESIECIVKEIVPNNDLTAKITVVPYMPAVFNAETGAIPPYDSQITVPPDMTAPPPPSVINVQTGEEALMRNADGSVAATIIMMLAPYNYPLPLVPKVNIRAAGSTDYHPATIITQGNMLRILDVASGETYDLEIFYTNAAGLSSLPLTLPNEFVVGAEGNPSDVTGFTVNIVGDTAFMRWDPSPDIDVNHYYIKYSSATSGATWGSSIDLIANVPTPTTSFAMPALTGTYLIKAVDFLGNESDNAAPAVSTVTTLLNFTTVQTAQEDPNFTGAKTNVEFDGTGIRLGAVDSIDSWSNVDAVANFDIGNSGLVASGTYVFANAIDLGSVTTCRLNPTFSVQGKNLIDNFDTIANIDAVADMDGDIDPSLWSMTLQVRTSNDNATWSAWMDFVIADYSCRYLQFQVLFESFATGITPYVTALKIDASIRA